MLLNEKIYGEVVYSCSDCGDMFSIVLHKGRYYFRHLNLLSFGGFTLDYWILNDIQVKKCSSFKLFDSMEDFISFFVSEFNQYESHIKASISFKVGC